MWKDDFGVWNKGFRIRKFSSLPQDCGVPEDRFLVAFLFRETDSSWTLEVWLKGRGICTNKARMPCPTPLAVDFALRSRAEAKALRAEKKARDKRIEEELARQESERQNLFREIERGTVPRWERDSF